MEKNPLKSSEKLNLKEEYKKSAGKKVPNDFFIYACMAEDHTLQTLGDHSNKDHRWPELAERRDSGKLDDPQPEKSFEESVRQLVQWYGITYPELTSQQPLDHAHCSLLVGKFILMINDLRQLVFIKTSKALPQISSLEDLPEIWGTIESVLSETFPSYTSYLMAYFRWVYAKPVERNFEISDLPPVGRYFGILKDKLRSKELESGTEPTPSRFSAPSSGDTTSRKNERDSERERPERSEPKERERPERSEPKERERIEREPRDRNEQRGEREYRDYRESRGGRDRGDRDEDKGKKDKEKLALLEVDKAILAMKKHSSMNEFRLRPQNSFIRRLQHRKINALGFQSHSVGEDDDRAVLITRED